MNGLTRVALAVAFAACCVAAGVSQSNGNIDLHLVGERSDLAISEFARSQSLTAPGPESAEIDPRQPVFLSARGLTRDQATALLGYAAGVELGVDTRTGLLRAGMQSAPGRHRVPRGYDVSVLCTRYVEYINRYGRDAEPDGGIDGMASEYVAMFVRDVLGIALEQRVEPVAVGHRIIVTAPLHVHGQVAALIELLTSDTGGESPDLRYERDALALLGKPAPEINLSNVSVGNALLALCRGAGVNVVVPFDLAEDLGELQTTYVTHDGETALAALHRLFEENGFEGTRLVARYGALLVEPSETAGGPYRIFELGPLLNRVADALQRQRTQAERADGFSGDIRTRNGIELITDALCDELGEMGLDYCVYFLGTKVAVLGGSEVIDAAEALLVEMGYEAPSRDGDE